MHIFMQWIPIGVVCNACNGCLGEPLTSDWTMAFLSRQLSQLQHQIKSLKNIPLEENVEEIEIID